MHVVMAVDMRRRLTKHINEAVELALQLAGNLFKRQSTLLRRSQIHLPSWPSRVRPGIGESGIPSVAQNACRAQLWHLAAQLRRVFNRLSVNQGRCRGHNPPATGFNNAVVLTFRETQNHQH